MLSAYCSTFILTTSQIVMYRPRGRFKARERLKVFARNSLLEWRCQRRVVPEFFRLPIPR